MSLRLQLLVFGLLTLALPWAGLGFIEQMEAALRQGLESSLLASAGTAANALASDPAVDWSAQSVSVDGIYAHRLAAAPGIDGYRGDWILARGQSASAAGASVALGDAARLWIGVSGRFVYVFVEVERDEIVYPAAPGVSPFGDRIVILLGAGAGATQAILLSTAAPGEFRAQHTSPPRFVPEGGYEDRVRAAWQETVTGFSVEARIPLALTSGAIGVAFIDVDATDDGYLVGTHATWDAAAVAAPLILENVALGAAVARLDRPGERYRVTDSNGWVLADTGVLSAGRGTEAEASYSERVLRAILRRSDQPYDGLERPIGRIADASLRGAFTGIPTTAWYRFGPANEAVVAAAVPITAADTVVGALVLEQVSDSVLTLGSQARMRLMMSTLVVSIVAAASLFAYATFLSFRIGRLARAAESALDPSGELSTMLPGVRARDEIGDLSRSFSDLLDRLAAYTSYLRTLTGKLAHEIRTPVAIVSTSLDNLEQESDPTAARVYLERMRQGAARLESILGAMSAATHVEQAVSEAPSETFDLAVVVRAATDAYRSVYPSREFTLTVPEARCPVFGSSDLLVQMLDKLVENAVSFSPDDGKIRVAVHLRDAAYELTVANAGPPLPEAMRHQVFDSLVSVRERRDGGTHLGLGLYIVALVAKYHGGRVRADNLPDGTGVEFAVTLPRAAADRH